MTAIKKILADFSIEAGIADVAHLESWREFVGDGAGVFLPHFRNHDLTKTTEAARILRAAGLRPIPHIAARNIRDSGELEMMMESFAAAGADEFLFLGGGENPPLGEFTSALQMMKTGVLKRVGAKRIGVAGHPEKHPEMDSETLLHALADKAEFAARANLDFYIATQFCFEAEPFINYLRELNKRGINSKVRLGIAGRVGAQKLIKFAIHCGIGNSLGLLRRQFSKAAALLKPYAPESLLLPLADAMEEEGYLDSAAVHFYPFGAIAETLGPLPIKELEEEGGAPSIKNSSAENAADSRSADDMESSAEFTSSPNS